MEWKNAVFLWVNISSSNEFKNNVINEGTSITWYGGSRMTADTPLIQRLQRSNEMNMEETIIMFIRFEKESYCCIGRLGFESCVLHTAPVQFIWRLKDIDRCRHKHQVKRIINALE